mmetsp:Transcript_28631/g.48676  ORF Transcript_28631/g.48676 Transcript_28631/m.48676 type:complete len:129 (-) Transcript_28631:231-617(-)
MPTGKACVFNSYKTLSAILTAKFIARMISWTTRWDSSARLGTLFVRDQMALIRRVTHKWTCMTAFKTSTAWSVTTSIRPMRTELLDCSAISSSIHGVQLADSRKRFHNASLRLKHIKQGLPDMIPFRR